MAVPEAEPWLCMVTTDEKPRLQALVVDCAAEVHVAPPEFLGPGGLRPPQAGLVLHGAGGHRMEYLGVKMAKFKVQGRTFRVKFHVAEVTSPLLSVAAMARAGLTVTLSPEAAWA